MTDTEAMIGIRQTGDTMSTELRNYIVTYRAPGKFAEARQVIIAAIDCGSAKLYVEEREWCREVVEAHRYTDRADAEYIADFSRA